MFCYCSRHIGTNVIFFSETAPIHALSVAINTMLKIEGPQEKFTEHCADLAKFCVFFADIWNIFTK